jgi:undecaprenyl phosphate-alpha-L-ara4N flippase subunit ArnF
MRDKYEQYKGVLFAACTVVLSACAQLLMKYGMLALANSDSWRSQPLVLDSLYQPDLLAMLFWVAAGLLCYAMSMLFWMAALAKYELSLAYPMLSLSYVLVYIGAALLPGFNESVTCLRTAGIVLIVIGVILVTRSKNGNPAKAAY